MSSSLSHAQFFNDFFPVATETIMLTNKSIQWAKRVCHHIADADEQWHSFLKALAIAGFDQWLNQGNTTLSITYPQNLAPGKEANIQVGDFQLCILPMGTLTDDRVAIPATVVTGENAAHLYVLVEVHEEVEQVRVLSGLRHDQLRQYLRQHGAKDYVVPTSEFTVSPEKLLWYLNCLNPEVIMQTEVVRSGIGETVTSYLDEAVTTVINTGKWLRGELDAVAEQLAWQLIPSLEPSYGFRDFGQDEPLREKTTGILKELRQQGVEVPEDATGACKEIRIGNVACEVYSLVWELPESQEWSLFVVLGPAGDEPLPTGLGLQVSDEESVLSKSEVTPDAATTYLYVQAIGNLDEQFTVEIGLSDGETLNLPTFKFNLDA